MSLYLIVPVQMAINSNLFYFIQDAAIIGKDVFQMKKNVSIETVTQNQLFHHHEIINTSCSCLFTKHNKNTCRHLNVDCFDSHL